MKIVIGIKLVIDFLVILFSSLFHRKKIFLLGVPSHGNLGDQAILYSELYFLKEHFPNYKIISIDSLFVRVDKVFLKKVIGKSPILIHGGGFLGTLWIKEEEMFRKVIMEFPNNTIITFPQTIYFDDSEYGKDELRKSQKIYNSHKNLVFFCREKKSFELINDNFNVYKSCLIPDMVLYLYNRVDFVKQVTKNVSKKNKVLFCIRKDKEKINYNFDNLRKVLSEYGINEIDYTDTVINHNVYFYNRKKSLINKMSEFSEYKLVVTDRLHGMIFCLLSKTPCIVFQNKSGKVKGVFEWIKDIHYIKLYNEKNLMNDIEQLLNIDKSLLKNNERFTEEFLPLVNELKKVVK